MTRTNENCHEYCRFRKFCRAKGEDGIDETLCPNYWMLDDLDSEERYDRMHEDDEFEDEEDEW